MAVKTYSYSKDGNVSLSTHFKVKEFRCKDKSDVIKISDEIITALEKIRSNYGMTKAVITSGYRTSEYNKSLGSSDTSQHVKGYASDVAFYMNGVHCDNRYIACLAQDLGFKGIGYMNNGAIHLDMRTSGYYKGDETKNTNSNVGGDFYKYFGLSKEQVDEYFGIGQVVEQPKPVEEPKPVETPVVPENPTTDTPTENPIDKPTDEQTYEDDKTPTEDTNTPPDGSNSENSEHLNDSRTLLVKIIEFIINLIIKLFKGGK